jgi:signal transduction histidine kinase
MNATTPDPTTHAQPTILVIDDELGPRESLRFLLKDDYRVLCADSVDKGVSLMRTHQPDTVIMDIRMPGRSGIEGLREIRSLDTEVSVIMLTGFAAIGTAQEAIRLEASDYMEKPFDAVDMRQAVSRHVEQTLRRRKRRQLLKEADSLATKLNDFERKDWLANLGQSSSEFVHDLRNAIAASSGSLILLRMEVENLQTRQTAALASDADQYLKMLENATQRCISLLDAWQRLIRQDPVQQSRTRLHAFVSACAENGRVGPSVSLTCTAVGPDATILADPTQLSRVLINLIQNASHALPAGQGRIDLQSERAGDCARIVVRDTGCGISPDNLKCLFTPHFTTRSENGGMGLGLFIAKKIVQAHGGTISVDSTIGQGTTFTIQLPLAPDLTADATA